MKLDVAFLAHWLNDLPALARAAEAVGYEEWLALEIEGMIGRRYLERALAGSRTHAARRVDETVRTAAAEQRQQQADHRAAKCGEEEGFHGHAGLPAR